MLKVIDAEAWGALPEDIQKLYTEKDGKYHPIGLVPESDVVGLKKNRDDLLAEVKQAKAAAKEWEALGDLDKAKAALKQAQELEDEKLLEAGDVDALVEKRTERMQAEHLAQVTAKDERIAELDGELATKDKSLTKHIIERKALDALKDLVDEVPEAAEKLLLIEARETLQLDDQGEVVALDAEDNIRYSTDAKTLYGAKDLAGDFYEKYGDTFWKSRGSGAPQKHGSGGTANNPWSKEHFNMTEQGRIFKANPAKARQMAAEHGVKFPS